MNLHNNQIQFSAARPTHVQFETESSHTAQAAQALAEVVKQSIVAKAEVDDEIFASQMNTLKTKGLKDIEDAKELNANYDDIAAKATEDFKAAIDNAPSDVRTRFLRRNPTAVEDFALTVNAAAALKTKNQLYNRYQNEISRLASEVVLADEDQQERIFNTNLAMLQNPNLDVEQVDNLTHEFRQQVERGMVASAMAQKDWERVATMLSTDDQSVTMSPAEKMHLLQNAQSIAEADRKAKLEEEKKKLEGKDKESQVLENLMLETFSTLVTEGRLEDAKKFQSQFVNGEPMYSVTGDYIGTSAAFSRNAKLEIAGKMDTLYNKNPSNVYFNSAVQQDYMDTVRPALDDNGKVINEKVDFVTYSMAKELYDSPAKFEALTSEQRATISKIVNGYAAMVTESLYPVDNFVTVPALQERAYGDARKVVRPIGGLTNLFQEQIAKRGVLSQVGYEYEDDQGRKMTVVPTKTSVENPQVIEGSFHNATKVFNDRGVIGAKIKEGTRAASALYAALGLAMNSDSVTKSLAYAGAPHATADMLSSAMITHLSDLWRNGLFDSEDISEQTVKEDLNSILFKINGRQKQPTDVEKIVQDGIIDVVLLGVTNPVEMQVLEFKNLDSYYPEHYTGKYLTASARPTSDKKEETQRNEVVERFRKRMLGE